MVMAGKSSSRAPVSDRARTSKSVRLDDRQGFMYKFNKTGFKSESKRHLYYYFVKCYEQVLRGKEARSVLAKSDFLAYRQFAEARPLRPLPHGFHNLEVSEKIGTLKQLIEEQVDAGDGIDLHSENVECHEGKMEVDEGSVADFRPECSMEVTSNFLQSSPRSFDGQLLDQVQQCVKDLKRWASGNPDILMEVEGWGQQGMALMTKLRDREEWESMGVDASNTLERSRQEEILSELQEVISVKDTPTQFTNSVKVARNFVANVERGAEIWANPKQEYAVDPRSTASSLVVPPDHCISEGLKFTPTCTGRLKTNLEEIHPRVANDLQYSFSKPTMEKGGAQVSHPQASDLWGNTQLGGGVDYFMTAPHSGGSSVSQIAPIGRSFSDEFSALAGEDWALKQLLDELAMEDSSSPLWPHSIFSLTQFRTSYDPTRTSL